MIKIKEFEFKITGINKRDNDFICQTIKVEYFLTRHIRKIFTYNFLD